MSTTGGPQSDPQTHLDTDPVNDPARENDADRREDEDREPHDEAASSRPDTDT